MRACSYCGAEKLEAEMAARVKVSVGEDLCFCSGICAGDTISRIADSFGVVIEIKEYRNGQ